MHIIKTNKRTSKATLIILGAVIALLAGATYVAYASNVWPFADHQSQTEEQEAANSSDETNPQQKKNLPSLKEMEVAGGDKTTDEVPVAQAGSLNITNLEQRNDTIIFAASLANITTPGTCSALFEHTDGAARPVTRTVQSTADGCPETAVPQADFTALGNWKLTLRYYVNDTQLVATKTLEVK